MKGKIIIIVLIVIAIITGAIIAVKLTTKDEKKSLERVISKGTLILGLDDSFPPMGFRNDDNEIVGFDIDVAKEVCKRLGVELILQPISWEAKEQELNSYNIDCIWNGMSVSDERKERMILSLPYLENKMAFVVKNDAGISNIEDLKGKRIGVQSGSTAEEIIQDSATYKDVKEVISYSENLTAFMDLEINQIDAVLLDDVVANYYIASNNKPYKVLKEVLETEEYAIGFRKSDTELCNKINEILIEMKKDGSLAEISEKWFGKDVTIIKEQ